MQAEARLDTLTHKHAELEHAIDEEFHRPMPDQLLISRMKREKLRIKDEIARLHQQ